MRQAVILAGGKGTRLGNLTEEIPKPLVKICNKTILEYQIANLVKNGITDVILLVGYLSNKIKDYFQDGQKFGVNITYFEEKELLGTAGAFYFIKDRLDQNFIALYGDVIFDLDFTRFQIFHEAKNALASLLVHPNNHPYDSDLIMLDQDAVITGFIKKNEPRDFYYHNLVNAGAFILNRDILQFIEPNKKQDLEKDLFSKAIPTNRVYAYKTSEYIKDMGTMDRYKLVTNHLEKGLVAAKNLGLPQKAIFLDRDGTINKLKGFLTKPEEIEIPEEAIQAFRLINNSEYLAIVITNQPVIARNLCSLAELDIIHAKIETELGLKGVYFDDLFFCPHHPDKGYPEERPEYKINCSCRKPNVGLINKAVEVYNIDLNNSYFIGDTTTDIQTGKNANLKTILLSTGESGKDGKYQVKADYLALNLLEAVKIILDKG
ncbi:MAG: HAD-IIIA family hydrolase [Candidatus Margulisiibacteriota bacterium]|jgi:histidinol-phosphate phosphatase family protein